jgi:hypothetical protein
VGELRKKEPIQREPQGLPNKGKGKVILAHAMKQYRGRRDIALLIPNLGTRGR